MWRHFFPKTEKENYDVILNKAVYAKSMNKMLFDIGKSKKLNVKHGRELKINCNMKINWFPF